MEHNLSCFRELVQQLSPLQLYRFSITISALQTKSGTFANIVGLDEVAHKEQFNLELPCLLFCFHLFDCEASKFKDERVFQKPRDERIKDILNGYNFYTIGLIQKPGQICALTETQTHQNTH